MTRLRIAIRPYWRERWVRRACLTPHASRVRAVLAALAVAVFLAVLACGCGCLPAGDPHRLEWDEYGCGGE
jgi:hypothetical protein